MPDENSLAHFNCTMGRLCWHAIRDCVRLAQVRGHRVSLIEGPGWIEREFRVTGSVAGVQFVYAALDAWEKATDNE